MAEYPDTAVAPDQPVERAQPIQSRFLFVDVAARRANQLRRGALLRLRVEDGAHIPYKLERAAMEEVRHGLIQYQIPELPSARADA
jgi:DNA-directed RNA polymerase subunit K/omega